MTRKENDNRKVGSLYDLTIPELEAYAKKIGDSLANSGTVPTNSQICWYNYVLGTLEGRKVIESVRKESAQ